MKDKEIYLYFYDKTFSSLEEALKYEKEFWDKPYDKVYFERVFQSLLVQNDMNAQVNPEFSNKTASRVIKELLLK